MPSQRDEEAIRQVVSRQFGSLDWCEGKDADWQAFAGDFHSDASLFPSARPAQKQTVEGFMERMKGLAHRDLRSFRERLLGTEVSIFGNVAIAMAACEITENNDKVSRGVEAILLIKDNGAWRIVSQAWDMEREGNLIPTSLLCGQEKS